MRAYLSDYSSSELIAYDEGSQVFQARVKQIRNIAYEIEDVLDEFLLHVPHQFHSNDFSQKLHDAVKFGTVRKASREFSDRIKNIDKKLDFVSTLDTFHPVRGRDQESRPSSSTTRHGDSTVTLHNQFLKEEEIVGFKESKEKLISQLMEGDPRFLNISLVVVLDNVWSKQDLECIVDALPNGLPGTGSKIVITTRYSEVVSFHAKSSYIHNMSNVLSWEEAWNLFCRKAFHKSEGKCPTQILDWAEKIVKKCEGLPLAISAVGTLLATKRPTPLDWMKIHETWIKYSHYRANIGAKLQGPSKPS